MVDNPFGDKILRFVIILIFAIIVICYSASIMTNNPIAGLIGIGVGVMMILLGIKSQK